MNRDGAAVVLVAGILLLSGCAPGQTDGTAIDEIKPAQVEGIAGTDSSRVVLTAEAADRIGLKTEPVREVPGAKSTAVPVAALVYDNAGATWVFTAVASDPASEAVTQLTFARQPVTVELIDGNTAVLRSGPAPGTEVVTVGVAELFGAEYGVEGE